jgi:thioredoxin reductase (NADPH)
VNDALVDVLIIGAGPAGLHAACTAQELGLSHRIIDRRGLAHSFVDYPQCLRFFSPPDEMEVGGVPLPMRGGEKPTREDILPYFRAVAASRKLDLALWEEVTAIQREDGAFTVTTRTAPNGDRAQRHRGRSLVLASGVWDIPNRLTCRGGDLAHVHSRFYDPTEYFGQDVLVLGGGNSAVHAALSLAEARARVNYAMRRPPVAYQSHLRPFVVRDLELAVADKRLNLITGVRVVRIEPDVAWLQPAEYSESETDIQPSGEPYSVPARFVFALLGQHADPSLFQMLGLCIEPDGRPARDPETFETNIPNVFVAGSLAGSKIDIILTGRAQAAGVVRRIAERLKAQ